MICYDKLIINKKLFFILKNIKLNFYIKKNKN
jgi:hypothetical protein